MTVLKKFELLIQHARDRRDMIQSLSSGFVNDIAKNTSLTSMRICQCIGNDEDPFNRGDSMLRGDAQQAIDFYTTRNKFYPTLTDKNACTQAKMLSTFKDILPASVCRQG